MADEKRNTSSERRRRPAPTIDLSATEVKDADTPPSPTSDQAQEKKEKEEAPQPEPARTPKWPILLATVLGGVAGAVAVVAVLWAAGILPTGGKPADALAPRVAALERQLKAPVKPADNPALAELGTRIARLEQTVAKLPAAPPDPASNERLAAIENAMKALGVTLTALNRRTEDSAAAVSAARDRADAAAKTAEALQSRLDAIERSARATQDKVAQNSGSDAVARRALAAIALRDAVIRGAPYTAELAIVKQLGTDSQSLTALEPFAQSGLPTEVALGREMTGLLPAMIDAAAVDASHSGGFFERLQANAGRLVRIQPIGEPSGDDPSAVLARIEVKAADHDLAGIESEIGKLPAKARAVADGWRKKVAARNAAIAASRKLAADSATALGAN